MTDTKQDEPDTADTNGKTEPETDAGNPGDAKPGDAGSDGQSVNEQ